MAEPNPPRIIRRHLCTPIATVKGHLNQQRQRQWKPTVNKPPPSPLPTKSHSIYTAIIDPHQSTGHPTVTLLADSPSNPIVVPTTFSSFMSMTETPFLCTHSTTAVPMKSNAFSLASMII